MTIGMYQHYKAESKTYYIIFYIICFSIAGNQDIEPMAVSDSCVLLTWAEAVSKKNIHVVFKGSCFIAK
jgi:hypothetical protein